MSSSIRKLTRDVMPPIDCNVLVTSLLALMRSFPDKIKLNDTKAIIISNEDSSKVILNILRIRRMNKEFPIIASYYNEELWEIHL